MQLESGHSFNSRKEISKLLGGDTQKGIIRSNTKNVILLFTNEEQLYKDFFYPRGTYQYCLYTGIGRIGHQDSVKNRMYYLNMNVLTHKADQKKLLIFEKRNNFYCFIGEYELMETYQNMQPDDKNKLRRVFVFHLKQIASTYDLGEGPAVGEDVE